MKLRKATVILKRKSNNETSLEFVELMTGFEKYGKGIQINVADAEGELDVIDASTISDYDFETVIRNYVAENYPDAAENIKITFINIKNRSYNGDITDAGILEGVLCDILDWALETSETTFRDVCAAGSLTEEDLNKLGFSADSVGGIPAELIETLFPKKEN